MNVAYFATTNKLECLSVEAQPKQAQALKIVNIYIITHVPYLFATCEGKTL
jgi:hypothetical protein